MTFEEFKKTEQNKPGIKSQSIFKVEIFFISMRNKDENGKNFAPYRKSGSIDLDTPKIYYCSTYKEAKSLILSQKKEYPKLFYSGRIIELPRDSKIREGEYLSVTVFDNKAKISCYSKMPTIERFRINEGEVTDTTGFKFFHKYLPFEIGQLIEVLDEEKGFVRLGVITENPHLKIERGEFKKFGTMCYDWLRILDYHYGVIFGENDHEDVNMIRVSIPSFPLTNDLIEKYYKIFNLDTSRRSKKFFSDLLDML